MNSAIVQWAIRHGVNAQALHELQYIFGMNGEHVAPKQGVSEAAVQSCVRLEAARKGVRLFRNNVGVLKNERGTPVRYGLANDSVAVNKVIKSSDLIGWRPVAVNGTTVAQFVARECKEAGWKYTGDERERAQLAWLQLVASSGGDAAFCTGEGTF